MSNLEKFIDSLMYKSDLEEINNLIYKNGKGRFELRKSKNNKMYLYDYNHKEIVWNKNEIKDILECLGIYL